MLFDKAAFAYTWELISDLILKPIKLKSNHQMSLMYLWPVNRIIVNSMNREVNLGSKYLVTVLYLFFWILRRSAREENGHQMLQHGRGVLREHSNPCWKCYRRSRRGLQSRNAGWSVFSKARKQYLNKYFVYLCSSYTISAFVIRLLEASFHDCKCVETFVQTTQEKRIAFNWTPKLRQISYLVFMI